MSGMGRTFTTVAVDKRPPVAILGPSVMRCNPVFIWGSLPPMPNIRVSLWKERLSSTQKEKWAIIPYEISLQIVRSIVRGEYRAYVKGHNAKFERAER